MEPWPEELQEAATSSTAPAGTAYAPLARRGRRLQKKTQAKLTAYADIIPLGSKFEAAARKRKVREANNEFNKSERAAKRLASATLAGCTGIINEWHDSKGSSIATNFDESFTDTIHSSHFVKAVNSQSDAVYCHRCGAYNDGGPLRLLRGACKLEVLPSRQHWYKLLTAGIVPRPGCKLPSQCRRALSSLRTSCRFSSHFCILLRFSGSPKGRDAQFRNKFGSNCEAQLCASSALCRLLSECGK